MHRVCRRLERDAEGVGTDLLGHIHGGLGYVAVFSAIVIVSNSGSAIADCAALSAIVLPLMRKSGYDVPV